MNTHLSRLKIPENSGGGSRVEGRGSRVEGRGSGRGSKGPRVEGRGEVSRAKV